MILLKMASDLITAQIRQRAIDGDSLDNWLRTTHNTLLALWQRELAPPTEQPVPSQPMHWKQSITQRHVTCLECGQRFRQLGRKHLVTHGLDAASYRLKHRVPPDVPLSAKQTTKRRREVIMARRPWEKTRVGRPRKGGAK